MVTKRGDKKNKRGKRFQPRGGNKKKSSKNKNNTTSEQRETGGGRGRMKWDDEKAVITKKENSSAAAAAAEKNKNNNKSEGEGEGGDGKANFYHKNRYADKAAESNGERNSKRGTGRYEQQGLGLSESDGSAKGGGGGGPGDHDEEEEKKKAAMRRQTQNFSVDGVGGVGVEMENFVVQESIGFLDEKNRAKKKKKTDQKEHETAGKETRADGGLAADGRLGPAVVRTGENATQASSDTPGKVRDSHLM